MTTTDTGPFAEAFALHQSGRLDQARGAYEAILAQSPDHADALHLLGALLHQMGHSEAGLVRVEAALALLPQQPAYHYNRGVILQALGRDPEAEAAYRQSLALDGTNASAWVNLGNLLSDHGLFSEAIDCHRNALRLQPGLAEHHSRLGRTHRLAGDIDNALAHFGLAVALDPGHEISHSALLFTSHYQPGIDLAEVYRRHAAWAARFADRRVEPPPPRARGDGPLRVGFLSPDLGNHPVGIFLAPLLDRLRDYPEIETVCFNDRGQIDEFTQRNRGLAGEWHDIFGLSDDDLEARLRQAGLDVLIELTGHTDNNRLPLLTRKPVPIQVSWAGYVGTTGLESIDYLMSDVFHSPDGSESFYSEALLRFPYGYIPYEPPAYAPEVSPLPLSLAGHPTFGCLNNPTKLTLPTLRLWAEVLRAVPDSRLLLKYKGMDDPLVRGRILGLMRVFGVEPDRIETLGHTTHVEHLAAFSRIDVALDPLPYSGGLSTCEAIWMGVPVVTLPGDTFASRHSLSHLSNAGLTDTIATSSADYVRIAAGLVADPRSLADRRHSLRSQVAASPLCDLDGFARDFLSAMQAITAT